MLPEITDEYFAHLDEEDFRSEDEKNFVSPELQDQDEYEYSLASDDSPNNYLSPKKEEDLTPSQQILAELPVNSVSDVVALGVFQLQGLTSQEVSYIRRSCSSLLQAGRSPRPVLREFLDARATDRVLQHCLPLYCRDHLGLFP